MWELVSSFIHRLAYKETNRKVETRKESLNLTDSDGTASPTVPSQLKGR
jgi:hypothetical protein